MGLTEPVNTTDEVILEKKDRSRSIRGVVAYTKENSIGIIRPKQVKWGATEYSYNNWNVIKLSKNV